MPTFEILGAGKLIATATAPSISAPAMSVKGGEEEGEKNLSPSEYARLIGGSGSGAVREEGAHGHLVDGVPLEGEEREIYIACLKVWAYWEKRVAHVPVAVLSIHALEQPAREAVAIMDPPFAMLRASKT